MKIPAVERAFIGTAKVYRYPSASREGRHHYVMVFDNSNGVQCTCEGWQYTGSCRHILDVPVPSSDP